MHPCRSHIQTTQWLTWALWSGRSISEPHGWGSTRVNESSFQPLAPVSEFGGEEDCGSPSLHVLAKPADQLGGQAPAMALRNWARRGSVAAEQKLMSIVREGRSQSVDGGNVPTDESPNQGSSAVILPPIVEKIDLMGAHKRSRQDHGSSHNPTQPASTIGTSNDPAACAVVLVTQSARSFTPVCSPARLFCTAYFSLEFHCTDLTVKCHCHWLQTYIPCYRHYLVFCTVSSIQLCHTCTVLYQCS